MKLMGRTVDVEQQGEGDRVADPRPRRHRQRLVLHSAPFSPGASGSSPSRTLGAMRMAAAMKHPAERTAQGKDEDPCRRRTLDAD
jgi:hypothetical protein